MIQDYENGIAPNPDVICNLEIKFGWFLNKCLESFNGKDNEITWIASGHYVQIEHKDSGQDKLMRVAEEKLKGSDERYTMKFNTPKSAIAPGQNVVVWDGNWCIGSGIIENSLAQ
ncbi:7283_t:CDS:2 [Funneliformis geosporum]|uniref:7283_t:CDS:1 n=1 Tax=Funneliformis geosporum TaxID=1117311 RepID=A0A9W4WIX0_9GLOM|nr:7283_t:CDS:2 [Funneliformis geosporum]